MDLIAGDAFHQDIFVRHLPSSYLECWDQDFVVDGVVGLTFDPGEDHTNQALEAFRNVTYSVVHQYLVKNLAFLEHLVACPRQDLEHRFRNSMVEAPFSYQAIKDVSFPSLLDCMDFIRQKDHLLIWNQAYLLHKVLLDLDTFEDSIAWVVDLYVVQSV